MYDTEDIITAPPGTLAAQAALLQPVFRRSQQTQAERDRAQQLALLGMLSEHTGIKAAGTHLLDQGTRADEKDAAREAALGMYAQRQQDRADDRAGQRAWQEAQAAQQNQWRLDAAEQQRQFQAEQAKQVRQAQQGTRADATAAARAGRNWQTEDRLADDFRTDTKGPQAVLSAHRGLQAIAAKTDAASDIAFVYNYMKMLDPGSVVREGEFATAQNAAGVPDIVRNLYNRAATGQRLNPQQRADMLNTAGRLAGEAQSNMSSAVERFAEKASRRGLDVEAVTGQPYTPKVLKQSAGGTKPASRAPTKFSDLPP